jgi:hypothetical protein
MNRGFAEKAAVWVLLLTAVGILGSHAGTSGAGQPEGAPRPIVPAPAAWPEAQAQDVESIDAIMFAFYGSSGGEAVQPRDWSRFKSLFLPDARLFPPHPAQGGRGRPAVGICDFVDQNAKYLEKGGFFDREFCHRVELYGGMAQVWSVFETARIGDASAPRLARGINGLQLLKDDRRWWIVSVCWELERADSPIPAEFLRRPGD